MVERVSYAHGRPEQVVDGPTGLDERFEALRWFVLPPTRLTPG
jgi:hypothetical protein